MAARFADPRKLTLARPWKWIDKRIDELDVDTDYVEIVRLSTLYRINDLQLHWFYAVGTPAAGIRPQVIDSVYRDGTGTYNAEPLRRIDDSCDHMLAWFEHGPDAPATQKSIDMVNRYHAHFARSYPDSFAEVDDYLYILCLNATLVNTAITSLGLSGFSEKERTAAHRLWSEIAARFRMADGRPVTEVQPFPESYRAMEECVEEYLARPWPLHDNGHRSTTAAIEYFAVTWFPRPLRFFGRAMVTSFMPFAVLRAHDIKVPPAPIRWAARRAMKALILLTNHVLPDPVQSLPDRRRRLALRGAGKRSAVDTAIHRGLDKYQKNAGRPSPAGCPHLAALD